MASNPTWDPSLARAAQDVEPCNFALREPEADFHVGRGGAANVARLNSSDAIVAAKVRNEKTKTEALALSPGLGPQREGGKGEKGELRRIKTQEQGI